VTGPTPVTRLKPVNEELKKELLKTLLEVYMGDELVFSSCFDATN
jgi:L-fucose mutarotase/ribose pyranase (RbsD/FucU family)